MIIVMKIEKNTAESFQVWMDAVFQNESTSCLIQSLQGKAESHA